MLACDATSCPGSSGQPQCNGDIHNLTLAGHWYFDYGRGFRADGDELLTLTSHNLASLHIDISCSF